MRRLIAGLFLLLLSNFADAQTKAPYNETANAQADITAALTEAGAAGKRVLVVFGANWCGDCRMLDQEMHKGELAKLVADQFVAVKVDVGRFKKNLDVVARYGGTIESGIPTVVILRPDASVAFRTAAGELSDARKMGAAGVIAFFAQAIAPAN